MRFRKRYIKCGKKKIILGKKKIFPNIKIKFCVWHFKRALENKRNKLCNEEMDANKNLYKEYKAISNLPFINPNYIAEVYFKIKNECKEKKLTNFWNFWDSLKIPI